MHTMPKKIVALATLTMTVLIMSATAAFAALPTYTIEGHGYTHGVGMSQMGAITLGKQGKSAQEIIKYYFKGASVQSKDVGNSVRVNLRAAGGSQSAWTLRPGTYGKTFMLKGWKTLRYDRYVFRVVDGKLRMYNSSGDLVKTMANDYCDVIPTTSSDLLEVVGASGPFSRTSMRYRGTLRVQKDGSNVRLINLVSMEDYLRGVVPRELGAYYNPTPATSGAQAIAARSYAYAKVKAASTLYCTTRSQVYGGHSRFTSDTNRKAGKIVRYEEDGANNAIDATRHQVATYGGNVITTYFGSCAGQATADKQDIWGGDSAPYYQSVHEPTHYNCGSQHSWTVVYDGNTLAAKLKEKGVNVPAGYVSAINLEYGDGGWVRRATFTFSSGESRTVSYGDNVRIKMGLKSAQFTINGVQPPNSDTTTATPSTSTLRRFEEKSVYTKRAGSWRTLKKSAASRGAVLRSKSKGASWMVKFQGTRAVWYGPKGSNYGRAKVYVDGRYKATVNLHSSKSYSRRALYRAENLKPGVSHTLKIVVTTKSSRSKSCNYVGVDSVDVIHGRGVRFK